MLVVKFVRDQFLQTIRVWGTGFLLLSTICVTMASYSWAKLGEGGLEGVGIECVVSDIKYERDRIPKYFIFDKSEVYRLLATKGAPAYIEKYSHGKYFESAAEVRWYPYILDRETLLLSKLRPSYHSREHKCIAVNPEEIEVILQKRIEEFNGK